MAALVRHSLTNFHAFPALPRQATGTQPSLLQRLEDTLRLWRRRSRERRELAALTQRDIRDIGVTPSEVWNELRQPFWRSSLHR